jgi:pyruvate-formate lyase-activating enzyme
MAVKSEPVAQRPPAGIAFHRVDGILLIRLMSRCNERCLFCMVADEIASSDDVAYRDAVAHIEAEPRATQIEFFGGEPTIYPRFLDLLRFARGRGHRCSIASNARIFHNQRYVQSVAELGVEQIYIRTSVYGETEALHDYYTVARGSYRQTVRGIRNIVEAGFLCQVNIVILKKNYAALEAMTRQVHAWGVPRIKYGMLTDVATCAAHAPSLAQVSAHLNRAIALAETLGLTVTIEKTPLCVIGARLDLISTEREIYGGERAYDDEGSCRGCLVRRWCDGLDPGYVDHWGLAGLEPVAAVPRAAITGSVSGVPEPELLRAYCVEIPDDVPDAPTVGALSSMLERIQIRHGRLAVFPARYIVDQ